MGTIADKLSYLNDTKTAIKDSIIARGVSVSDSDTFRSYATKIGEISGGGAATKYGASVDTFIGDVVDGVLQAPTAPTALNFAGITEIRENALCYTFYQNTIITSVDLSLVQSVDKLGLNNTFCDCRGITSLYLSSLQSVGYQALYYTFCGCSGITGTLDLSSLTTVGDRGLYNTFRNCKKITSVYLSSLQSVGSDGMSSTFRECAGLTTMSFPSLTSVQTNSLNNAFAYCTELTEIHFRADMQATIEACTGYENKFGATNASIIFDL